LAISGFHTKGENKRVIESSKLRQYYTKMLKRLMKFKNNSLFSKSGKGEGGTLCIAYRAPVNQQITVSQFQIKETITNKTYPRAACSQTGGTIAAQRW